jgi:DNA-binding response OmpR family regulator
MAKKVFVIEDDRDIRETIVYVLEEEGYQVLSSESAKLLKQVSAEKPDIILLDNWLTDWKSDASGQQLSYELKSNPDTRHIPVVIISAVSNVKQIAEEGLADDYLMKPFDVAELVNMVKKHTA